MERREHFQWACRLKKKTLSIKETPEQTDRSFSLGVVSDRKEPWSVTLHLNVRSTLFCIDTREGDMVISKKIYIKIGSLDLKNSDKMLKGPSRDQLGCKGHFVGYLQKSNLTIGKEICLIKN